jgi:hypothetical protein
LAFTKLLGNCYWLAEVFPEAEGGEGQDGEAKGEEGEGLGPEDVEPDALEETDRKLENGARHRALSNPGGRPGRWSSRVQEPGETNVGGDVTNGGWDCQESNASGIS